MYCWYKLQTWLRRLWARRPWAPRLRSTGEPGEFWIPELDRTLMLRDWEERDIYDTVMLPAVGAEE